MIRNKDQRVGIFVDVSNMYYAAKYNRGRLNFANLLKEAVGNRKLIRAISYVVKADVKDEGQFFETLEKVGYEVKSKDLQVFAGGKKKGDWDVGIAMDMIKMAPSLDVLVLVSGDGDYEPVVEYLQNHGKLVEVYAFGESCSNKMKERADYFEDMTKAKRKFLIKF